MGLLSSKTWINLHLKIVKMVCKNCQVYETLNHDKSSMTTFISVKYLS
jgi:RNase P subunit RPR2